jgi:hypothetical protein
MIAYEFYSVDKRGEAHCFAILPERRKNPGRITEQSIMKWGRMVLGGNRNFQNMYFVQVEVPKISKRIRRYQLNPLKVRLEK